MSVDSISTLTILKKTFAAFHVVIPAGLMGILLRTGLKPVPAAIMDLLIRIHICLFEMIPAISTRAGNALIQQPRSISGPAWE